MTLIELAETRGLRPEKVSGTHGGEYHSACPACGGKDRFIIQPNRQQSKCIGYYFCRQCNIKGDTIQFLVDYEGLSFQKAAEQLNIPMIEKSSMYMHKVSNQRPIVEVHEPSAQWKASAASLVDWAHQELLCYPEVLAMLASRGLSFDAVKKYKFGYVPKTVFEDRDAWGLPNPTEGDEKQKKVWIPQGIIIPFIEHNGDIVRLKIRRTEWHKEDQWPKYVIVSGSMSGLNIIGSIQHEYMIVVESELDAYAINSAVGDFFIVIAVGSNTKNQDSYTDYLARKSKKILICHDNDDRGLDMLKKWAHYPQVQAYPTPIGKDIGEAVQQGFDLRAWFREALPIDNACSDVHAAWSKEDQDLIDHVMGYIESRRSERVYDDLYEYIHKDLILGPNGPKAKTRVLQNGLRLLRDDMIPHEKAKEDSMALK